MLAHELLRDLAVATRAKRCLLATSQTTGNPLLSRVEVGLFETLVSMQYGVGASDGGNHTFRSIEEATREVLRLGQFDVAFVDPFHTYDASLEAFRVFGECTRRSGWLVAHDCFPPFGLAADTFQPGPWCGSTYAAFRDTAVLSGRAWLVIDDDFGLGVLGPQGTSHLIRHDVPASVAEAWDRADITTKRELLRDHGPQVMRVVSPKRAPEVLAGLLSGASVAL